MSRRKRALLLSLEALVCFGPIGLVLLLGIIILPFWANMLASYLSGAVEPFDPDERMPWDGIWPIVVVICGVIGFVGLMRVLMLLSRGPGKSTGTRLTLAMVVIGIAGLVLFHWRGGGVPPLSAEAVPVLLMYWILPAIGTAHFLYLARHSLFPSLWRAPHDNGLERTRDG